MTSCCRLAVHGDDLAVGDLVDGVDPGQEAVDKLLAVQGGVDAADGVLRGDAIGQLQVLFQPGPLGMAEFLHADKVVGAADHGGDGQKEDVAELVSLAALDTRILKLVKIAKERKSLSVLTYTSSS
jgi:hypothetical protein